ncbi:MAG: hypothetical protein KAI66_16985, partial [Lentisphaeria bacterium]|nr:hypothetical protein [Lentisphaeria bacterium]
MRMLLVGWVCLTLACKAAEIQAVNGELRIPQGKTRTVEFGTVPQNNTTVLLDITSRLDSEGLGGSMYFMKLELNGRLIIAARSRKVGRLRNRKLVSPVAPRQPYSWFGNNSWRVLYAPDFKSALKQTYYEGNPHRLLLDVTDLTNPAAENRLKITNMATTRTAKYSKRGADLVIKTLTVRTLPEPSATMTAAGDVDGDVINRGTPGAGPAAYRGKLLAGGGFTIDVRGRRFGFASAMSYPNAGLNHLAAATRTLTEGQPGWQRTVTPTADGGTVVGVGPDYRLERTVRFTDRKVEVTDRFVNRHLDAKLGLLVENTVSLRGMDARVRLGGNPDPAMNSYYANGNPSVYATIGEIGLGLICEDDVFRNQARLFYDADRECAGLRTEMLCLQPGGSYTLRWSVYPVASNDYFDF